jgi:hypothetical protein
VGATCGLTPGAQISEFFWSVFGGGRFFLVLRFSDLPAAGFALEVCVQPLPMQGAIMRLTMRDALIFALLVAVAFLGYEMHSQNSALVDQQRQIKELNSKLEAKLQTASLELQEKCSKQAHDFAEGLFTSHYNEKLNKCFILIVNMKPQRDGNYVGIKELYDAFEGKSYGEYSWNTGKLAPYICKGTLLSGDEKFCHSSDEFDGIVKLYMQ